MARLVDGGYDLYVVSNGNPEMLDSMVSHADIGGLLEDTISADEVETFKPDAEIYRHAAGRTGTPIEEIAHAAALWFDVQGAQHSGMQGVWMDRKGSPWEPFDGEPSLTVETVHGLADELGV
jgi:2-haloacid dehalogenase